MTFIRRFLCLLWVTAACATAHAVTRTVVSEADLKDLGIAVERFQLSTPMASAEVGTLVDPLKAPGVYQFTECVILVHDLAEPQLKESDAGASGVTRRSKSVKDRTVFLVLGREVPRAYVAFQFLVRTGTTNEVRRYLLPVTRIRPVRE